MGSRLKVMEEELDGVNEGIDNESKIREGRIR